MKQKTITVALAGNPNSGKTTIFNDLTGARQHVGNYGGVTVEKKEGFKSYKDYNIKFIDLPGTYSLTAHSLEEVIARNFIIDEQPDVVVNVVDSGNIERNFYLTTQLLELDAPLVVALNMYDMAEKQGLYIDSKKIGASFNAKAVKTVGSKGKGIDQLLEVIVDFAENGAPERIARIHYGDDIEQQIDMIEQTLSGKDLGNQSAKWRALKLLEQDEELSKSVKDTAVKEAVDKAIKHIESIYGESTDVLIAEKRYGYVSGVWEQAVKRTAERRHEISDVIDKVLLSRVLGLPIFLALMYVVFKLTFWVGDPFMGWLEQAVEWFGGFISSFWEDGSESLIRSLLVDGIIGGVGAVIVFLPNIILLFLGIAMLEDSGYMARAAFLMDKVMKKTGLHGRSFIPMLIGFGCSVPAIMATRILDDKKSRFTTILVLPLMSCGARLPIYTLIIPAFFASQWHGFVMWIIYIIGIALAIVLAKILRVTAFKGETGVFIMELPPYRMPTIRGLLMHMWQRSGLYLKKAGTIILAISIVLWAITSFPKPSEQSLDGLSDGEASEVILTSSVAGKIGKVMEPVIKPLGFDYKIGTALIGALAAKEVFVSQLGIVYSIGEADEESETLREKLRANYTSLQGFCIMLFCLISAPCVATLAICRREMNSWMWAAGQFAGLTVIAYVITLIVYQVGSLFV